MSKTHRSLALLTIIGAALAPLTALPVRAAEQPKPQPPVVMNIGVIDMERISDEATPVKDAYQQLNTLQQNLTQNLHEIDQYTYLTQPEVEEFALIQDAGEPSQAQKSRFAELKKTAEDREKEFAQLVTVKDATADQKKRLEDLTQMRNGKDEVLEKLKQKYQVNLNKKAQEILPALSKQVEAVIAGVAQEKKLNTVLAKRVTSPMGKEDVVLFGGTDITDDVIKKLNSAKK
ncbi:MAG TPA: OmpH family outer membrane protein [Armatimonadota bacterium]|nr:OmpH family outer membrane protein [Armatimonadota bacterium]